MFLSFLVRKEKEPRIRTVQQQLQLYCNSRIIILCKTCKDRSNDAILIVMSQPRSRLKFEGCSEFRYRIAASILSGKAIKISKIRENDEQPGLHDFEANFLRLIEALTDGTSVEINETGTILRFSPGLVIGGTVTHDCGSARSIGWFLEPLIPLLAFAKEPTRLSLSGITNNCEDVSVDIIRNVTIPLLRNFGVSAELRLKRRGAPPNGGGLVEFSCSIVRELQPVNIVDMGLIKRVRGVAYSSRISPTILTRVVDSVRGVLNHLLPDVYVHTDHYKGAEGGNSPGYSVAIVAGLEYFSFILPYFLLYVCSIYKK
jgi:RNA 3'-terminal phosphate cyclase-like protein